MKASSYFTDAEIEIAMGLLLDFLTDGKNLEEVSISHDAGDRYVKLFEKMRLYFGVDACVKTHITNK